MEAKVHRLHSNQARRDMFDFSEIIFDYISLVGSCKVALVQRGEKLKRSQEADTNMTRKQEIEQKLKGAPATKPEKLTEVRDNSALVPRDNFIPTLRTLVLSLSSSSSSLSSHFKNTLFFVRPVIPMLTRTQW